MITQKQAIHHIRSMGASIKISEGEYRINIPKGNEATAYYTDDPEDAINTARHMMVEYQRRQMSRIGQKKYGLFGA